MGTEVTNEIERLRGVVERLTRERDDVARKARAEALEEAAAFVEGKGGKIPAAGGFAFLISRNNQPCMSGDPRDRLTKFDRSRFDEATAELANAIRALKETKGAS